MALALLLAAGQLGYMCSRSELGDLRADLTLARQTEAELRERLAESAPGPGAVPAVAPEVDREAAEQVAAAAEETLAAARAEASDARARAEAAARELEEAVAHLRRAKQAAEQDRRAFASARTRLEQERARLRERVAAAPRVATRRASEPSPQTAQVQPPAKPAPPPNVAASQAPTRPAAPAASSCPELQDPQFTLREIGASETRLGGRLLLRLEVDGGQLALRVGSGARSRYLLSEPPQRFAFDCAGTAYVVAVCDITNSPLSVSGRVSRAEDWRDACRG